jgi:aspartate racemase
MHSLLFNEVCIFSTPHTPSSKRLAGWRPQCSIGQKGGCLKKVGVVGGIGWQATLDYYAELCHRAEELCLTTDAHQVPSIPEMSIESLDMRKAISYLGCAGNESSWARFDEYHRTALLRLAASGVDFALLASNTPHHRFDTIVQGVGIPVLDLHEVIAQRCALAGARRVLILGTAFTMQSQRLRNAFSQAGVDAAPPADPTARAEVAQVIADAHRLRAAGAAERIARIACTAITQSAASLTVCLACTELLLAFPEHRRTAMFEVDGIRYVNASALHMEAAFDFAATATESKARI